MPAPGQVKLGLLQRIDLRAAQNPRWARRQVWFSSVLGLWALISAVSSLAMQHWKIATLFMVTVALSGVMWWVDRRAIHRIPETSEWIKSMSSEGTPSAQPGPKGDA